MITPLTLLALPLGAATWTFMEYVLHRGFHTRRGRDYASREHLLHHGSTEMRWTSWILSWIGVLGLSLLVIPLAGRLLGAVDLGLGLGVGYLVGYAFYELVHWRAHHAPTSNAYEQRVRKHHFIHHFHAPLQNHGVTTTFWDRVFGTLVERDVVTVPRRMAMTWLLDDDGRVREEHRGHYAVRGASEADRTQREDDLRRAFANEVPA